MASIMRRSAGKVPEKTDLPGLAWLLEASYSDMEEVLKGVAANFSEETGPADSWHQGLLDQMVSPTAKRAAVLTPELRDQLDPYRAFRHFSRYSTFRILEWDQMAPLVEGFSRVADRFCSEVELFLTHKAP